MPTSQAFTKRINPQGQPNDAKDDQENSNVHQSSPSWILTFVRWDVRDTLRALKSTELGDELLQVRKPLVVENDCIQVSVSISKSVLTHSMQATLLETDINYETAIAPGDFVFVNMLNWDEDARRIAIIAKNSSGPINRENDGFKGIFKVQSVRRTVSANQNGVKRVIYRITGFSFTEFNNSIYYNPYLRRDNQGTAGDALIFASNVGVDYSKLITPDRNPTCQDMIQALIQSFIGVGVTDRGITEVKDIVITPNVHFMIPSQVGAFLGNPSAKAAKDVYDYMFGIQLYSGSSNGSLESGMNPSNIKSVNGRFTSTAVDCVGTTLLKAEYWNQQKAWSIINQYTNAPINELFTSLRISPSGSVMPTVVFRQIPFSSDFFGEPPFEIEAVVTTFLSLPRWKIHPALVIATDLGRDEAARINFVQFYATPSSDVKNGVSYLSNQTASGNYIYDANDVKRSGLRPMVISTSFQDLTLKNDILVGKRNAYIIGDCVIGEHLKLNGSLECIGIVDPIAVGDNLEYDGTVFHIEEVNHSSGISPDGMKSFRTVLRLSHGVSTQTGINGLNYPEMEHTSAYEDRRANYDNGNRTLPGISEEQDTVYRPDDPAPNKGAIDKRDKPFAQPGQMIKPRKKDEDDE